MSTRSNTFLLIVTHALVMTGCANQVDEAVQRPADWVWVAPTIDEVGSGISHDVSEPMLADRVHVAVNETPLILKYVSLSPPVEESGFRCGATFQVNRPIEIDATVTAIRQPSYYNPINDIISLYGHEVATYTIVDFRLAKRD